LYQIFLNNNDGLNIPDSVKPLIQRIIMKNIKYTVWKEDKYYISQCLNIDISSFGKTIDESINNLMEAIELYFENNDDPAYTPVENVMLGERQLNV